MGRRPLVEGGFDDDLVDAVDHLWRFIGTAGDGNSGGGRRCVHCSIVMRRCRGGWRGFDRKRRGNRLMKTAAAFRSRRGSSRKYSGEAAHQPQPEHRTHRASGESHHFAFYPDARRFVRREPIAGFFWMV